MTHWLPLNKREDNGGQNVCSGRSIAVLRTWLMWLNGGVEPKNRIVSSFVYYICNPPGSAPSHRAGLEPGMPAREAGALPRRELERLFFRSGEWGLHTALTGIHPLHIHGLYYKTRFWWFIIKILCDPGPQKNRCIHNLQTEWIIFQLMYGLLG